MSRGARVVTFRPTQQARSPLRTKARPAVIPAAPISSLQMKLARLEAERPAVAQVLDAVFDRLLRGSSVAS